MYDIELLLLQAWKLAIQKGNTDLAGAIVSLPGMFITRPKQQEPKQPVSQSGFRIPSGKYRGMFAEHLTADALQNVWSGFNGCGNLKVASALLDEINRRKGNTR